MTQSNIERSHLLLSQLADLGVKTIVSCAGARNAPLLQVLFSSSGFDVIDFFEERSGAFFALGRAKETGRPSAIITTSGTATAELLPAMIEAHYSEYPLIAITADRPKHYRGSGAPQAIEQVGIFGPYVESSIDWGADTALDLSGWSRRRPLHINPIFDEPLIDRPLTNTTFKTSPFNEPQESSEIFSRAVLDDFLKRWDSPIVLLGEIPGHLKNSVTNLLIEIGAPIYAEGHSQLRGANSLSDLQLRSGDKVISKAVENNWCDSLIRIGGVPTLRFWRELENTHRKLPVLNISHRPFTGLGSMGRDRFLTGLTGIEQWSTPPRTSKLSPDLMTLDAVMENKLRVLLSRYPRSQQSLLHALSCKINSNSLVYLGNSLTVRDWDLTSQPSNTPASVAGNRGANGIDGQLSTFLGMCRHDRDNWAIVGDLTALYDGTALWVTEQLTNINYTIVVVNNQGGRIFEPMFKDQRYVHSHNLNFEHMAAQWKIPYKRWESIPTSITSTGASIVELTPNLEETRAFIRDLEQAWLS